jgi:hypothetical protein
VVINISDERVKYPEIDSQLVTGGTLIKIWLQDGQNARLYGKVKIVTADEDPFETAKPKVTAKEGGIFVVVTIKNICFPSFFISPGEAGSGTPVQASQIFRNPWH